MIEGVLGLVGAIGAAFVAAGIGLFSLLIAKDQKISEFRQAWIDSFRSEMSEFVSSTSHVLSRYHHLYSIYNGSADFKNRLDVLIDGCAGLMTAIDRTRMALFLRVNPSEDADFIDALNYHYDLMKVRPVAAGNMIEESEAKLMRISQQLLKREWRRVKSGERLYAATKWASLLIAILGILASVSLAFTLFP